MQFLSHTEWPMWFGYAAVIVEHHHLRDEDDDSSPHREHDLQ